VALASGSSGVLLGVDQIYPEQQLSLLMYSGQWATRNADLARGFMVAYVRGVRDYLDAVTRGRDRAAVAQSLVDLRVLREPGQLELLRPVGLNPNGRVNIAGMKDDLEHFLASGVRMHGIGQVQVAAAQHSLQ
jgi:NitT/TauT family transport system substrate-binding protein